MFIIPNIQYMFVLIEWIDTFHYLKLGYIFLVVLLIDELISQLFTQIHLNISLHHRPNIEYCTAVPPTKRKLKIKWSIPQKSINRLTNQKTKIIHSKKAPVLLCMMTYFIVICKFFICY